MIKRLFDIVVSITTLILSSPLLFPIMLIVYLSDGHSPFYIAPRVGQNGKIFRMIKLRSMVVNADKNKVDSTSKNDPRITLIGRLIRTWKLDELTQLFNVLKGDMSLVGPRPNVERETRLYTQVEQRLLSVKPGITDFSSIVFSDEGDILKDHRDPDLAYNQLIRPWKSRLSLFSIDHQSLDLDLRLIYLTALAMVSRPRALEGARSILGQLGADEQLIRVASRRDELSPYPPPGATEIVTSR